MRSKNVVESKVQQFWKLSLAWKGKPGFTEGVTVGDLISDLNPLIYQYVSPPLAKQAETLSSLVVKGRWKRKKCKGQVINMQTAIQKLKTKKIGQSDKRVSEAA